MKRFFVSFFAGNGLITFLMGGGAILANLLENTNILGILIYLIVGYAIAEFGISQVDKMNKTK